MTPVSRFYYSQRLKLHYLDWGNEQAPPLLLIHGGQDHCRNWDWVVDKLHHQFHIITPDLRGHGDSQWTASGNYQLLDFVYDIHQLIEQKSLAPLRIVGHSLGGAIGLHYAGLFPETVAKIIAIEGLGPSPKMLAERARKTFSEHTRNWFADLHKMSSRQPKRYNSLESATERMKKANPHLSDEVAQHLTLHAVIQNEDGSFSWKFDPYLHIYPPYGLPAEHLHELWGNIQCPTLLVRGEDSWASNPATDGRANSFSNAQVVNIPRAGHWVHHDQLDHFIEHAEPFLTQIME